MDITTINYVAVVLGVILVSMTLHEAMHGFMAYYLGDDTAKLLGRLTLNPIKHIDPFLTILLPLMLAITGAPIFGGAKPVPFNPSRVRHGEWGSALVALAGPLTNFLLSFISFGLYVLLHTAAPTLSDVFLTSTMVNLGFFIFNMIPIPPLDGSRVLYALAPDGIRRGMEVIERNGLILIFAIVLIFSQYLGNFMIQMMQLFLTLFSTIFGL